MLADHPDQRRELVDDRSLIPGAIEELLRFETPSPVNSRYVTRDVEHYGRVVPAGSVMVLINGAANRDDRKFPNGDTFDIHRKIDRHLSFGYGLHFCLGAALARLEGRVALDEVLTALPHVGSRLGQRRAGPHVRGPRLGEASRVHPMSEETAVADKAEVQHETRLLIDGALVDAASGKTFDNVNPATEEVLGVVADASTEDMQRAIAAARRAFDDTTWSTDRAFRQRCLEQLQAAIESEQEELREELILEVGCPRMLTHGPQLDVPLEQRAPLPRQADRRVRVGDRPPRRAGHAGQPHQPPHREGGGRGRRRHRALELSLRGHRSTSSGRRWPRATRWCSSPPPTPRGTPPASAA